MQCHSYFPVCHSHYDLNVDANGGAAPLYNGNSTFRSGHYNDYMGSSPLPRQLAYAYRESLRQTMLMHEDTFRDQVQRNFATLCCVITFHFKPLILVLN